MTRIRCRAALAAVVAAGLLFSGSAWAAVRGNRVSNSTKESNAGTATEIKEQVKEQFCDRVGDLDSGIVGNLEKRAREAESKMSRNQEQWQERVGQFDSDIEEFRTARDTNIEAHFSKLEERATTDDQKQAVSDFEAAMKAAIEARRDAIDAARNAFRDAVKSAIGERNQALEESIASFKNAVSAAVSKAKSDCSGGTSAQQARTALKASVKAAHDEFVADRKVAKVGDEVSELAKARNEAITKAMSDFRQAVEDATGKLKEAFPEG